MARHKQTLDAIFADPVRANIPWNDIESLFKHYGATVKSGRGSRVRIELNGVQATFHRPHPQKEAKRGAIRSVRRFFQEAGITP